MTPAALTITANDQGMVYGSSLPALTAGYSGFVNGDTSATLATAPTLTTTATAASPVGSYGIAASGAVDANYSITYVGGTLTVTPAALTITANDQGMVYGSSLPTLTAGYHGFVNGDTSASFTTAPTLTTTATAASSVGSYGIAAAGAVDCELQHHLRGRHADGDPGRADRDGQRSGHGLRVATAGARGQLQRLRQWRHQRQPHDRAYAGDDGHGRQPRRQLRHRGGGGRGRELQHHLHGRHAHGDPGRADDYGQRGQQGLRLAAAGAHGQLQRLRQWRHQRHPRDRAHADDYGHGRQSRRQLRHRGLRGRGRELQHHLRGRHADGDPGRADDHGQRSGHGLRVVTPNAHGRLPRLRQWRHQRQFHDGAHADDDGHGRQFRRQLRHRGRGGRGRRTTASPTRAAR